MYKHEPGKVFGTREEVNGEEKIDFVRDEFCKYTIDATTTERHRGKAYIYDVHWGVPL